MTWIFVALLEPVLYAITNILDSSLVNRFFKNAWIITLGMSLALAIFAPLVWFFSPPYLPPLYVWPAFLLWVFWRYFTHILTVKL